MLRVFSYDVSDDKRRRHVARILERVGTRVQYSVFEVRVSKRELSSLVEEIESSVSQNDSVRVYTLGGRSARSSQTIGAGTPIDCGQGHWLF